jgi:hypothetical protein
LDAHRKGDSGILGTPQVRSGIPPTAGRFQRPLQQQEKSQQADQDRRSPIGQWNTFRIKMVVTKSPSQRPARRQCHHGKLRDYRPFSPSAKMSCSAGDPILRSIYIREIQRPGLFPLFNGAIWPDGLATPGYVVEGGF